MTACGRGFTRRVARSSTKGDKKQLNGLIDFLADERRNMRLFETDEWVDV